MTQSKYINTPRDFFDMLTSNDIDVNDCIMVTEDCLYVTYRYQKGFEKPSPNTNADVAAYVTTHARLELYS